MVLCEPGGGEGVAAGTEEPYKGIYVGVHLGRGGWAVHIFREHDETANDWAKKRIKNMCAEWVDEGGIDLEGARKICRLEERGVGSWLTHTP